MPESSRCRPYAFLDLPVSAYVSRASSTDDARDGRAARRTCSAVLSGIIQGYGHADFGEMDGWSLLPRDLGSWAHCLAFLTPRHLDQIITQLEQGELKAGLHEVVLPVIEAIDRLVEQPLGGRSVLPRLGQYSRDAQRLELALELPWPVEGHRYIDVHCYPFRREVTRPRLLESASRAAGLIVLELLRTCTAGRRDTTGCVTPSSTRAMIPPPLLRGHWKC